MKKRKFILREKEGGEGGSAGGLDPNKWKNPDGIVDDPPVGDPPAGDPPTGDPPTGDPPAGDPPGGGTQFTPNELWSELQAIEGFKMPEGITKENELDLLKKALIDNKLAEAEPGAAGDPPAPPDPLSQIQDPDIQAYLRFKKVNPEATLSDYMSQRTMFSDLLALPDKDFMAVHLRNEYGVYDEQKNPDGLREEEIDDLISGMEANKTLTLEARKYKKAYREHAEKSSNITDEDAQKAETVRREQAIAKIKSDAQKLFAETEKITELNGVKLGKAEITQINQAFQEALLPNDQGEVPIVKMLQSDRILWNFFAVNYLGDEKFKSALFEAGDATKETLMKRLGLKPIASTGRQSEVGKKNTITPSLWSIPDETE